MVEGKNVNKRVDWLRTKSALVGPHKSHISHTDITKAYIGECYKDIFGADLGKLPVEYRMKLDPEVKPVIRPPRRIPVSMQDKVKAEFERMVKMGVIKPVSEPASWVSSFVAVKVPMKRKFLLHYVKELFKL